MPITAHFFHRLMNSKTTITLSTMAIAAVALLFASGPIVGQQAFAQWWGWLGLAPRLAPRLARRLGLAPTLVARRLGSRLAPAGVTAGTAAGVTAAGVNGGWVTARLGNAWLLKHSHLFLFFMNLGVTIESDDQFTEIANE